MVASVISVLFEKRPWQLSVLVLFLGLLLPLTAQAQVEDCDCINCPQFLPDLSNTDFYVEIKNATNQTMGQNGQMDQEVLVRCAGWFRCVHPQRVAAGQRFE